MNTKILTTKVRYNQGQVMLTIVMLFLLLSMTVVLGIGLPVLKQVKISLDTIHSKESYYLAEAGLEDAVYRLKTNKTVSSGDTVTLNGYTATVNVINNYTDRIVDVTANRGGLVRKMEARVIVGVGTSFNYALETGIGGINMSNNAGVSGNIYSNGDVIGSNGAYVTGSVYAADSAALLADQSNGTGTPPNTITFGNTSSTADIAQSFQVSTTGPIHHAQFYIKKTGNPGNATVKIVTDNAGLPSSNVIDTATLGDSSGAAAISASTYGWVTATFSNNIQLNSGTTYWVIIDTSSVSSSNNYTIAANSGLYSNGLVKIGIFNGTWNNTSPAGLDEYFQIYLGGLTATISGVNIGSGSVGDAWAHTVNSSTIHGSLYCQGGTNNHNSSGGSISCNTSRSDPTPQGFPISDANVQEWKNDAAAGTIINGDYTPAANATVGPIKVTGNMTINSNMTIGGTIWVQGNLTVSGGAIVKLASGYSTDSGIVVVDGIVSLGNGAQFQGSGQTGSYVLLLTTSDCPISASCSNSNAIDISNNAGAVILNAQNGTVHLSNNAGAKEITAYELLMDNNANVTYDSGLINLNFTSGPTGGWNIKTWQEVP